MLESVVGVFSRFTSEALLFQSLGIFILTAFYAAYWILKKRRVGAVNEETVSPELVKEYLGQLIGDAQDLRGQLFGMVNASASGVESGHSSTSAGFISGITDPQMAAKFKELEVKMQAQAAAMNAVVTEKSRIESELLQAKSGAPAATAPANDQSELLEKIKQLEAKLAEYSIIEDDLANLKRLQQENAQLKAQVGGAPTPAAAIASTQPAAPIEASPIALAAEAAASGAASITEAPKAATSAPSEASPLAAVPADASVSGSADPAAIIAAQQAGAQATAAKKAPQEKSSSKQDQFEGLVDQVEKSLEPVVATADAALNSAPSPATTPTGEATPPAGLDKSDADLVEEFERMLNG